MKSLIRQICAEKVLWSTTVRAIEATHILDFGPGHMTGIGALTHKNMDGSGIQVRN